MIGLDTNVLVRYIIKDDVYQAERVSNYIHNAVSNGERLYINCIVMCEFVWVLESCYSFNQHEIQSVLEKILISKYFEIEFKDIIRNSINDYINGKGDLADYIIGRINTDRGCKQTVTFDRALKSNPPFELLRN